MKFSWHPDSFAEVVRLVTTTQGPTAMAIRAALGHVATLSCPPPSWDPAGSFRVALVAGAPTIQRLDSASNSWAVARLTPPRAGTPMLVAEVGQRVRVQANGAIVEGEIVQIDESQFPGVVVVRDGDGVEHRVPVAIGWP